MSERLTPGKTKMKVRDHSEKEYGRVGILMSVYEGVCLLRFKDGVDAAFDRESLDVMRGVVGDYPS